MVSRSFIFQCARVCLFDIMTHTFHIALRSPFQIDETWWKENQNYYCFGCLNWAQPTRESSKQCFHKSCYVVVLFCRRTQSENISFFTHAKRKENAHIRTQKHALRLNGILQKCYTDGSYFQYFLFLIFRIFGFDSSTDIVTKYFFEK